MTEFKDAVEKQRGLQLNEQWSQRMKSYEGDCWEGTRTTIYNDGRKEVYDMKTNKLIEDEPRNKKNIGKTIINGLFKILNKIGFYNEKN